MNNKLLIVDILKQRNENLISAYIHVVNCTLKSNILITWTLNMIDEFTNHDLEFKLSIIKWPLHDKWTVKDHTQTCMRVNDHFVTPKWIYTWPPSTKTQEYDQQ